MRRTTGSSRTTRAARALIVALLGLATATAAAAQESSRLRVSLVGQAAHVRTARATTVAPERDVALQGVDAEFWLHARGAAPSGESSREGLGFALGFHRSTLGGDDLSYRDLTLLYGLGGVIERLAGADWRDALGDLALEASVGGQAGFELSTGMAHGEMHGFTRLGLRAATRLAASPLALEMRLGSIVTGGPDGEDALTGFDGESALRWSFERWPVQVALGYRLQRMRVYRAAQEVSALRLELGWRGVR